MRFFILLFYLFLFGLSANSQQLHIYLIDNHVGLVNNNGKIIVQPIYSRIGYFKEGLAAVETYIRAKNNYNHIIKKSLGYIDKSGKLMIPMNFESIDGERKDFSEGLAVFKRNNKYGYINRKGRTVISPIYTNAFQFNDGLAIVYKGKEAYSIDKEGNIIVDFFPLYKSHFGEKSLRILMYNSRYRDQKIALKGYKDGVATFCVVDKKGNTLFMKPFDMIHDFENGIAVAKGENWGLINEKGENVTPLHFKSVNKFNEELYIVREIETGKTGIINKNGEYICPLIYQNIFNPWAKKKDHDYSIIQATLNSKHGYINKYGEVIIDFQYDESSPFGEGLALVKKRDRTVYGINKKGEILFELKAELDVSWYNNFKYNPFPQGIYHNGLALVVMEGIGLVNINKKGQILKIKK
tara:strand:- start:10 stop:1239 length:1230 start_codon:yes stop_codon:yes gene_type:complete